MNREATIFCAVATLRGNPVLSEGFARGARTSRSACPQSRSFRGICSQSSHIPLRLRRGGAKERQKKVQASLTFFCLSFAERTGFEPVSRFRRLHAFQACLFSHSSIFPLCLQRYAFSGNYNIRPLNLKSDLPIKKACHTSTPVIR